MLKARVHNGRLVLDEPTALPEGTEVQLEAIDTDELDADDRRRLHAALAASEEDVAAGRLYSAEDVIAELRGHSA